MPRAPTQAGLPPFLFMLQDYPWGADHLARHLGISSRTMARYVATQQAPRAVMLALFWETRWGVSVIDAEAANAAQVHRQHAQSLTRENAALKRRIQVLEAELIQSDPVAANLPFFRTS